MHKIVCILPLFALMGCAGYQARLQTARAEQQRQIDAQDDATCRGYGAAPGSEAYVACRMNLANNRTARDIAQQQSYDNMLNAGAAMMQNGR